MGFTWRRCPFNIAMLSIPPASRSPGRAPTGADAPALPGAMAGLLGRLGGDRRLLPPLPGNGRAPFWGIWYLGGMLIPAVLGWLFGPALLRW